MTASRLAAGGRIDRARPVGFTWEGRSLSGWHGDTVASALLANDVRVVGRGFKYHRPRGIYGAWSEEPNAIVDVAWNGSHEANARATLIDLRPGMAVRGVNASPSVGRDRAGALDLLHRFIPAGFYYKTFMRPNWHRYEPRIRAMAGLGRASLDADRQHYEARHAHCDVLVVGGGPAGLAAARAAAAAGLQVVLADDRQEFGGSLLWDDSTVAERPALDWVADTVAALAARPNVRLLPRTVAFGYYDGNALGLIERREAAPDGWAPDRLWQIRARQVVLASGAIERPLVFPDNDRPGVMSAAAVLEYLRRYGVLAGDSVVVATNNDSGYECAMALRRAGAAVTLADVRPLPAVARRAVGTGVRVLAEAVVLGTGSRGGVTTVDIGPVDASSRRGRTERVAATVVATAGGWSPTVHLYSQSGGKVVWNAALAAFVPGVSRADQHVAGSMAGVWSLDDCLASGHRAGVAAARALGREIAVEPPRADLDATPTPLRAHWQVPVKGARQWLDLQNDVTVKDVQLAARENYVSIEHLKRYTTLGMATDQGKTSNVNGLAVLAEATGRAIPAVGTTTFRPPFVPVSLGALAGMRHGALYSPRRTLPAHDSHVAAGAEMREYGGWLRPAFYRRDGETPHDAVQREAMAARADAGLFDGSSLGKIVAHGPDAAAFLNLVYYNEVAKLKPGRLRYVLLLREAGTVYDDGVVARLAPDRYLLSPSSSHTAGVLATLEAWRQTEYPTMRVAFHDCTAAWATFSVCGPRSRAIVAGVAPDADLSDVALPHMALIEAAVAGVPGRIARVSFTGERSYELSVPASHGAALWERLLAAGPTPYGIKSLSVLRAEKGYILIGTDTDGMTLPADLGLDGPLRAKTVDFIGRRSLSTPDALRPDRRQFVGLLPLDPAHVPPPGSHAVEAVDGKRRSIGWVTSSAHSPALGRSMALGVVQRGRARHGETVALFHLGQTTQAKLCSPVFFDPEGARLHG